MKFHQIFLKHLRIVVRLALFLFIIFNTHFALAEESDADHDTSIWSSPMALYQATISKADGQRCPMYPSCSHYAAQAVKRHGIILGWLLTGDRLLRCGRDETRRVPKVMINGSQRAYDPLAANTFWWSNP